MVLRKVSKYLIGGLLIVLTLVLVSAVVLYFTALRDFAWEDSAAKRSGELPVSEAPEPQATVAEEPAPLRDSTRDDNGVWLRRHWLHGGAELDPAELVRTLDELGIRRIYPFLGPMDEDGKPGWRKDGEVHHYEPETARRFLSKMQRLAPHIAVMPWTGGVLGRDVRPTDEEQRKAYAGHMATIAGLGADGVHINVEPLPSEEPGYLDLLRDVKEAIGAPKTLSIAAYPPTTPLHPAPQVHWTLDFTKQVCMAADELVFMGYDTALTEPEKYEWLMAKWTKDLLQTLPAPEDGGCEVLIGVPAYEDDEPYHRPNVENIEHGIRGVEQGLAELGEVPAHFRGIAVYASWTTDATEWGTYQKLWRAKEGAEQVVLPDYNI